MTRPMTSLLLTGALALGSVSVAQAAPVPDEATLYKNPQCGCCDGYADHLEEMGIKVTVIDDADMGQIKQEAGLPYGLGSCHTVKIGRYTIEGHVPFDAIEALFEQRLRVDGIGLAGMPIGTPGMPGPKQEDWDVYQFTDQEPMPFLTL